MGRLEAEEEAGGGGGCEASGDRGSRDQEAPLGEAADRPCRGEDAAGEGEDERFDEELALDVAAPCAEGAADGDLAAALGDRDQHDVHDAADDMLEGRILPAFGPTPLHRISARQVRDWFDAWSRTAPGGANKGLELLRQIVGFAIACGHIETDPTRGTKPNRRPRQTRFLSRDEIARLHRVLDDCHAGDGRAQADIIRLLLLTGCRKSEIVRLRRSEVRDGMLVLEDGKTGPRTVPLNSPARAILEHQPVGESPFVFPSPRDPSRPRGRDLSLWQRVRREAGIEDVRLHDLRHTHASHAVMNGVPVPVVSRLLGHSSVGMTLRYAHLGDRDIERSAERVGQSIAALMGLDAQLHPLDTSSGGSSG